MGLFAQMGVYGVVCASIVPMTAGILLDRPHRAGVFGAAVVGPLVHFTHYGTVVYGQGRLINPAVTATEGVLASIVVYGLFALLMRNRAALSQQA